MKVAPKEECKGIDHMQQFLQNIIDEQGEGIILRDPLSPNQAGRSSGYLKHKVLKLLAHFLFFDILHIETQRCRSQINSTYWSKSMGMHAVRFFLFFHCDLCNKMT
jgi:hypothetical protein